MAVGSFGELITDDCYYAFDPCFEVLDENKPLQINISNNEGGKVVFPPYFINDYYNSTFKDHNSLGLISFV